MYVDLLSNGVADADAAAAAEAEAEAEADCAAAAAAENHHPIHCGKHAQVGLCGFSPGPWP